MKRLSASLLALAIFAGCSAGNKYSTMPPEYGGQADFPGWPALQKGVVGYNLYLASLAAGPWEKINDIPITGGRTMVPHLEPGKEYFFRLTSVGTSGAESVPGAPFKRKAVASKIPN